MAEWGKERKTGLGVTLGEMSVPTLFSPCLTVNDRQEHPSPWIQGTHWHYYTIQSLRVMNIYDSTVLHKCVSTQFLQTWDNNNTFYFKVRRHLESISFWRKKKKKGAGKYPEDANSRNAADLMIQRQDCREISGSQVGMTHHTETVVRADVKGWLRDPGPSCLSRGEGQTQQERVTHRDKRSRDFGWFC